MKRSEIKKKDKEWSKKVREIGYCEKCGKTDGTLQPHHIFSRKHRSTRWDVDNGVALCVGCHIYWAHKDCVEFADWIREYRGKEFIDELKKKANSVDK